MLTQASNSSKFIKEKSTQSSFDRIAVKKFIIKKIFFCNFFKQKPIQRIMHDARIYIIYNLYNNTPLFFCFSIHFVHSIKANQTHFKKRTVLIREKIFFFWRKQNSWLHIFFAIILLRQLFNIRKKQASIAWIVIILRTIKIKMKNTNTNRSYIYKYTSIIYFHI